MALAITRLAVRTLLHSGSLAPALLVLLALAAPERAAAGEVRLKNGTVIQGKPVPMQSLTSVTLANPGPINIYPVVMIDTGWQRYFVPARQVVEIDQGVLDLAVLEKFELPQRKAPAQLALGQVGTFLDVTPFDEFGRRTVTVLTPQGKKPIVQGIDRITPHYVNVVGITQMWESGLATSSIPPETLDALLRTATDQANPNDRLAIARFYLQAGMHRQARQELDAIAREFPDLKDRVQELAVEVTELQAREFLSELKRRREAGQHRLAYFASKQFPPNTFSAAVMREAEQLASEYEQGVQQGEKALALLGELQAGIDESELQERLAAMRSVISHELSYDTLERLNSFLLLENDASLSPREKLALAYSGWVLGGAKADTDLPRTLRLWDARFYMLEFLRSGDPQQRQQILGDLLRLESVGPSTVLELIPNLPLPLDAAGIESGKAATVEVTPAGAEIPVSYSVLLPPEYHPHHQYPFIVALRSQGRTTRDELSWWGGTAEQPGHSQRRGYIVIAPEYADPKQEKYDYSPAAHHVVLESLRDARKRFRVDSDRVFLGGHGMGGDAAFDIGMTHPDEFAGVMPVSGICDEYCRHYWSNAKGVGWYVVGGELDRDSFAKNASVLERYYTRGHECDIIYVQFVGRGFESYHSELPNLFDWMDLRRRPPLPRAFEVSVLRQSDNHFYWLDAIGLPRNVILPQPAGAAQRIATMPIKAEATPGNTIHVNSAAKRHVLWLSPELIDFDKRVQIRVKGSLKLNDFVKPNVEDTLEHLRLHGDRRRTFWARLEL